MYEQFHAEDTDNRHLPLVNVPELYLRAEKVLSSPVDPKEFTHYKDVAADMAFVREYEGRFREEFIPLDIGIKNAMRLGRIFEAIMFDHIERSDWLGQNATTVQASRFDDIRNGVDCWTEFNEGDQRVSHLALAFDVTTSDHIRRKIARIKDEIEKGQLTHIKYFKSDALGIKGEKSRIPRVVLGTNKNTVYDLAQLWAQNNNQALGQHPIQFEVLEEMRVQLEAFRDYAHQIGRTEVESIYDHGLEIAREIIRQKGPPPKDLVFENDNIFREIQFYAQNIATISR